MIVKHTEALVTSCRSVVGIPLSLRTFKAYIDEEQEPTILSACPGKEDDERTFDDERIR